MEYLEAEEIIRTEHLTYEYQAGCPVLQDLSVSIHKGEKIAVMGSNGAGKSTFFLHLNGVLQAGKGKIFYGGAEIRRKDLNGLRKHVGFVFQDADNQMIASSVQAEVAFGPMNLKLPKEEVKKRVSEALEYMDLQGYRERPPHYLSGKQNPHHGWRQAMSSLP